MALSFSLLTLILFLGVAQAITVLGILLYQFLRGKSGDIQLILLFFMTLYVYLSDLLIPTGLYRVLPFFIFTDFPVLFTVPPLLYFYVSSLIGSPSPTKTWRFYLNRFLHFVPFILVVMIGLPNHVMPFDLRVALVDSRQIPPPIVFGVDLTIFSYIQFFIYFFLCWRMIRKYYEVPEPQRPCRVTSVRSLMTVYLVTYICLVINYLQLVLPNGLGGQKNYSHSWLVMDFPIILICIYNYYILLKDLSQQPDAVQTKYKNSGLSDDDSEKIYQKLVRILQEEELWYDPDLNLRTLADKIGYSYNHVSQAINKCTCLNYHGLINHYRIDEACRLLETTALTVIEVAYKSGFNSKATFNTVFKREMHCTPSEYRKNSQKNGSILSVETI